MGGQRGQGPGGVCGGSDCPRLGVWGLRCGTWGPGWDVGVVGVVRGVSGEILGGGPRWGSCVVR